MFKEIRISASESAGFLNLSKQLLYYILIGLAIYWIAHLYKAVLSSLVLGALLAYLLIPLADFMTTKLRLRARVSAWLIFISFIALILTITRVTAPIIIRQINTLTNDFQIISQEILKYQPFLDKFFEYSIPLDEIMSELENEINQILMPTRLFRIIRSATDNIVWLMVTLMTCFYLLIDHKKFQNWLYSITPNDWKADFKTINRDLDQIWKTYLRGQLIMMLLIGIVSGIGGFVVGLRNALIIGAIAGILEIIPSLGPTVSTIIAGMTAWTQGSQYLDISNFWFAVLVCGIFIAIQAVENTILLPRVMSKHMNLHPALVFVAVLSTFALYGVIATLIVIPLIASTSVIIQFYYQKMNGDSLKELPADAVKTD